MTSGVEENAAKAGHEQRQKRRTVSSSSFSLNFTHIDNNFDFNEKVSRWEWIRFTFFSSSSALSGAFRWKMRRPPALSFITEISSREINDF